MSWFTRVANSLRQRRVRSEIDRELSFHISERADELKDSGMDVEEALRQARMQLGHYASQVERTRDVDVLGCLESLVGDFALAFRSLGKNARLSALVVATLTMGIGLNTAVFTLINAVVWRAPVDRDPGSYVSIPIVSHVTTKGTDSGGTLSLEDYVALRDGTQSLRQLAGWRTVPSMAFDDNAASETRALLVTCNFFSVHTLDQARLGRLLQPGDCDTAAPVVVLSEEIWRDRFGADPGLVGRAVHVNGQVLTVIGIAPSPFAGRINAANAWLPYTVDTYLKLRRASGPVFLTVAGRLRPGFTLKAATSELQGLASQQDQSHPGRKTTLTVTDGSLWQDPDSQLSGFSWVAVILGVLSLLLLVACANVATLLLSRAAARRNEIAVRIALGAGTMRLLRMLATESLVLAAAGGAASLLLAYKLPAVLLKLYGTDAPYPLKPDLRAFAYLAGATLLAALLSGSLPTLESLNLQLVESLKSGRRVSSSRWSWKRHSLVCIQVALSLTLLAWAGAVIRTRQNTLAVGRGFESEHVLVAKLRSREVLPSSSVPVFNQAVSQSVERLPGVRSVAYSTGAPNDRVGQMGFRLAGHGMVSVNFAQVSPGYFSTLQLPIVRGREFQEGDSQPDSVIVSQEFARRYFDGQEAVGKTLELGSNRKIVGVAKDTLNGAKTEDPIFYEVLQQTFPASLVVRFEGDPRAMERNVASALRAVGPNAPNASIDVHTVDAVMRDRLKPFETVIALLALLAAIALGISLIGIYGAVSFSVGQRRKEVGIRVALGARRLDIVRTVVIPALKPVVVGIGAGLVLAGFGSPLVNRILRADRLTRDPWDFTIIALLVVVAAAVAMIGPSRKAVSADPVNALREE